jgi:hypothetical protein
MPLQLAPNNVELLTVVPKINTVSSSCVNTQDVSELKKQKEEFIRLAAKYLRVAGHRNLCISTFKVAVFLGFIAVGYTAYCDYNHDEYQPLLLALPVLFGAMSLLYSISYVSSLCKYNSVKSQLDEHLVRKTDVELAAEKNLAHVLKDDDKLSKIRSILHSQDSSSLWNAHNRNLETNKLRSLLGMEPHY